MKTFRHRCPAAPTSGEKAGIENCKAWQQWPVTGTEATACGTCDFVPGLPWQREMAAKMGVEVEDEATPEAEKSGGESAEAPAKSGTASGARSR